MMKTKSPHLQEETKKLLVENASLKEQLFTITNSKFFRFWRRYHEIRSSLINLLIDIYYSIFSFLHKRKIKLINLGLDSDSLISQTEDLFLRETAYRKNKIIGFDNVSNKYCEFKIENKSFRESVTSLVSGTFSRQRQMVIALSLSLFKHPYGTLNEITRQINKRRLRFYTTEANGALFENLKQRIETRLFYYSEYFSDKYKSGKKVNGILHEDLQKTSFKSNFFDIILTSDVMEHVADATYAEREIVRILRPGGYYCFTLPFIENIKTDVLLAKLAKNGEIKFLHKPEYHLDPLSENGSLVFRKFSYLGLKVRFEKLNCKYICYKIWSQDYAMLGNENIIHIVTKN